MSVSELNTFIVSRRRKETRLACNSCC